MNRLQTGQFTVETAGQRKELKDLDVNPSNKKQPRQGGVVFVNPIIYKSYGLQPNETKFYSYQYQQFQK